MTLHTNFFSINQITPLSTQRKGGSTYCNKRKRALCWSIYIIGSRMCTCLRPSVCCPGRAACRTLSLCRSCGPSAEICNKLRFQIDKLYLQIFKPEAHNKTGLQNISITRRYFRKITVSLSTTPLTCWRKQMLKSAKIALKKMLIHVLEPTDEQVYQICSTSNETHWKTLTYVCIYIFLLRYKNIDK